MKYLSSTLILTSLLFACSAQKELKKTNADLEASNKNLMQSNQDLADRNQRLEAELNKLNEGNMSMNAEFARYKDDCEQTRQELTALEEILTEISTTMEALYEKLQIAADDFAEKGVDVYRKDGLIYVQLQDDLMYKSGSAVLDAKGKKALGSLASALNEYPNLEVVVVGHTDDRLFKKGTDNWTLSTERANGVVRILRDDYQVDPSRLIAAGRGRYDPVADNSTETGKAKNRRTEIILRPDYRRLLASVEKEKRQ